MQNTEITKSRAEELLRFPPNFSVPNRKFVKEWIGGKTEGEVLTFPFPEYEEDVLEFFHLASQEWWTDYQYDPEEASRILQDDRAIETADLKTLKTLLTYCVRRERFGEGCWGHFLDTGKIQKLLIRLQQLVPMLPS